MGSDFKTAAQKLIHGGKRDNSGRKRRYLTVEPAPHLWLTLEAVMLKWKLASLEAAGSLVLNDKLETLAGQVASARSEAYFEEKRSGVLRKRRYNFPRKKGE